MRPSRPGRHIAQRTSVSPCDVWSPRDVAISTGPALRRARTLRIRYTVPCVNTPIVIELEPDVEAWLASLSGPEFHQAAQAFERLEQQGHMLRMPYSRALGHGLFELRFLCGAVHRRITYWFAPNGPVIALTTFRKQRGNERREIERARTALQRCRAEHVNEAGHG